MNRKLARLLEPSMKLYFIWLVLFTGIAFVFNPSLAGVQAVIIVILYIYQRHSNKVRANEVLKYIESVTSDVDTASRNTRLNAPLPMVIFQPDTDEVIWSNQLFLQLADEREHLFDTKLSSCVPQFDSRWLMEGKHVCPKEVIIADRRYQVFGSLVRDQKRRTRASMIATTYWVDVTEYSKLGEEYNASRPVVAILLLDNYEDAMNGADESQKSALLSHINKALTDWVQPTGGLFTRYDRSRYLFVFEERYLAQFQETKFDILDAVHDIPSANGVQATLSIGVGRGSEDFKDLFAQASLSIEMALSRGGDQAVVKSGANFNFFGGRSKEIEKRTKVKSRVMANALGELVADSSHVFVMGHKFADLDCLGACAGVCAIARKRGIPASILREDGQTPASEMTARLEQSPEYADMFISSQDALVQADPRTLLVVVDTNRPEQVISEELLECCTRVAVIDHHRRAASYISNAALNFHEPYASSASELVAELLQYILEPSDLLKIEAEAVLAGIVLDTKNFTMRTGTRTFEAAAFLRRSGADTNHVKKLFQNDLSGTIARYDIIRNARMHRDGIAIAVVEQSVGRVTAAQASDELLNIAGIDASFVLFPEESGQRVIISARSMSDVNVQVILEALGGGGNAATAGAQVESNSVDAVFEDLTKAIDGYFGET